MRKHVQKWMHVCALSFLSKFPRNRCPARLSRVMLNLQPADNSIAPPVQPEKPRQRRLAYVGMTRAREHLTLAICGREGLVPVLTAAER